MSNNARKFVKKYHSIKDIETLTDDRIRIIISHQNNKPKEYIILHVSEFNELHKKQIIKQSNLKIEYTIHADERNNIIGVYCY